MKILKTLGIGGIFLFLWHSAFAGFLYYPPAFNGQRGLFRVYSARTLGNQVLGVSLHGQYSKINYCHPFGTIYKNPNHTYFQGDSSGKKPDKHHFGEVTLGICYSPSIYYEVSFAGSAYGIDDERADFMESDYNYNARYDTSYVDVHPIYWKNVEIAMKGGYPSPEYGTARLSYAIALQPFISFAVGAFDDPVKDSICVSHGFVTIDDYPTFLKHNPDIGFRILTDFGIPKVNLHLNFGYRYSGQPSDSSWAPYRLPPDTTILIAGADHYAYKKNPQDTIAHDKSNPDTLAKYYDLLNYYRYGACKANLSRSSYWLLGGGIEFNAADWITMFFEAVNERPVKSKGDATIIGSGWPKKIIAFGIRFNTPSGLTIDGAYERRIDFNPHWGIPSWNASFGLSTTSSLLPKPKPKPFGTIAGKVTEVETGNPLEAKITAVGVPPESLQIKQDIVTGLYTIAGAPGTYRIHVAASDSYYWQEKPAVIQAGQTFVLDFALKKKEIPKGTVIGKVSDFKSGEPLGAKVIAKTLKGVELATTVTDLLTGIYTMTLPPTAPGEPYSLTAIVEGYNTQAVPIMVADKQTTMQHFSLKAIPKMGERFVLKGINFRSGSADILPTSYVVLDEAAKILKDYPTIKVEIGGHTDSRGRAAKNLSLSEARAAAVRNYLINIHNIDPTRLVAKGYGESMPIAPNRTKAGRAENRRIEFVVIGR
ncbi:MAG: OmpA family protein [Candidatus Edwardsbacteria bacterium]